MVLACMVVEDTADDLEILQSYVADFDQLALIGHFSNVVDAREFLYSNQVDLIFCDIMIGDTDGLSFIKSIENCPQVIFTTSFPNFAVTGFELEATDYLVKPYTFKRFSQAANKAIAQNNMQVMKTPIEKGNSVETEGHFFIRSEHNTIKINYDDVTYIEGLKDYVKIFTPQKIFLTAIHLKIMESQLPADLFIRIHRSYIVNVQKIESLNNFEIIALGKSLPLGESYRENFFKTVVNNKIIRK